MIFHRDALNTVVCNIRIPNDTGEEVATAIFVEKENQVFLLTAAHVIANITARTYVVLSDANGTPARVDLSILLGGASFVNHATADLTKAKINVTEVNRAYLENRCFPFSQIETKPITVSKDLELTTIGFPFGLGVTGNTFSPLTFRTFVSAPKITLPRFDNKTPCDFIILELPSIGGYSGGPLFDLGYVISGGMTSTRKHTILHGIVHGTISDPTGGKLAAITPTSYLNGWL